MKRLYVAIALIIISVLICTYSSISVEKSSQQMCRELKSIGYMISSEQTEKAVAEFARVEGLWKKNETLFSFIVDADKIEEMNIGFSMIKAHLQDNDTEHALERVRECEFLMIEISENEKLNIKNIM